ncbi:MAG: AAA family ATPase [Rhizobiaceae bacterium]|nr:AAA family ATPase [Rhizobiaceae bacterium]
MRLRRLDLTRYGRFTDYSIDFGAHAPGTPDLHIVYGLNEAGKSTSLSAYLDLLFGIEERTRYGFLHQGKAMEIGACLEFDGQAHDFRRIKQRNNSLLDAQGQAVNEAILSVPLAGLTRDAYRMMFSLDDQTLEEGGNAILESKGDLGELLFSASAGLAGISSSLEAAVSEADGIFRKRASSTKIAVLKRQISDLKTRRDEIDIQASAYKALTTSLQQATAAYDEAMRETGAARARHDEITRILRAHPLAADYRRIQAELQDYRDLPRPPAEWWRALPGLMDEDTRLQTRMAGLEQRAARTQDELDGLVVDQRVLDLAERFDQLTEAAARYTTAQEDLPKRRASLAEWSRKVELILATIGQVDDVDPKTLLVAAPTIGALRDLIADKSGIDVARQSAEKEVDLVREAIEKERIAQKSLDSQHAVIDAGKVAQLQATLARLRESDVAAEIRLAKRDLPERQRAFDDAMNHLHPLAGDGQHLQRIAPPRADRREAWKAALAALDMRRSQIVSRQSELASRLSEEKARIAALHEAAGEIGDEEAATALSERDEAWAKHLSSLDRETALHFEDRMRRTDTIANARLGHAKQLEELRSLTSSQAVISANLDLQGELLRGIDAELNALRGEIRNETPSEIELAETASLAVWLSRIDRWADAQAAALEAWNALRRTKDEIENATQRIEAEQISLTAALRDIGMAVDGLSLAALVQAAENALAQNATLQSKRTDAEGRLNELEASFAQRSRARDAALARSQEWQDSWVSALAGTWFADRHDSVGAVRELLDAITTLPEALREQDEMQHRIDAMEADREAFANMVGQVHMALGETPDGEDALTSAKLLIRRHEDTTRIQAKREEREQSLGGLSVEREALSAEIATHSARKREMTDFFGVETLAEVRQSLEHCRKRDDLAEQQSRIAGQIVRELQQPSLDEAILTLTDVDRVGLQREQAELVARLDDLDQRTKALYAEKVRASDRLSAVDGDDAVARIASERRTAILELEDLALRYLRLRSGSLIAEHALRAYRDKHRSAMMRRASEAFRLMTRDQYSGLATRPDKDREALIGLSRQGGSKLAVDMSKGTRFQLYLALRLAGYEEFATARPSVPFVADDIMETFDEPRSEEVFRLFSQMAQVGQVIYLTHHRHLCEIARQTVPSVSIHEIDS